MPQSVRPNSRNGRRLFPIPRSVASCIRLMVLLSLTVEWTRESIRRQVSHSHELETSIFGGPQGKPKGLELAGFRLDLYQIETKLAASTIRRMEMDQALGWLLIFVRWLTGRLTGTNHTRRPGMQRNPLRLRVARGWVGPILDAKAFAFWTNLRPAWATMGRPPDFGHSAPAQAFCGGGRRARPRGR
jgi:hypothetical protein